MTTLATLAWVSQLARRYEQATDVTNDAKPELLEHLTALQIASAALKKVQLDGEYPERNTHIAVLGPTQSGKSSLANVLLDSRAASVSALAGFTVHTQGYAKHINAIDTAFVDSMMHPLTRTSASSLDSERLDCFVLEEVATGSANMVSDAVVWDTPDFDSIKANSYSLAVLKTAALADVAVVVVSKDKYGDKRVWDMLSLLISLGKPLLVCINKLDDADRAVVENAFRSRFVEQFGQPLSALVMLPFVKQDGRAQSLILDKQSQLALSEALHSVYASVDSTALLSHCTNFISQHEAQWLAPLIAEVDAQERWAQMVQTSINEADQYYADNYLDNPDKYETFNRALAELLTFLEIPGVAPALAQARKLITWPARRLLGVGRSALGKTPEIKRDVNGQAMDQEALVLEQILDTTLIRLQRELLEAPNDPWWQALNNNLRTELPNIRKQFAQSSEQARREFAPEIEKAAASLYDQLEKQPALLNTLRAARASADAAGIALAVKSGGLAPADLILAPAMLSVTTLLTESALGRYLDTIKSDLKKRQRLHIKHQLLDLNFAAKLQDVATLMNRPDLLSNDLEPELSARLDEHQSANSVS